MKKLLLVFSMLICSMMAVAVQPDEVLDDPELEARARALSQELRCVVCQGETIDASDAQVARNLRIVLRDRLKDGMSDDEIMDYMRARYGDFILMKPRFNGAGAIVWLTGPLIFLFGSLIVIFYIRKNAAKERSND